MNDASLSLAMARPLGASRAPYVLRPFDRLEALTLKQASELSGRSEGTIRRWAANFDLGRRIGVGRWAVSKVALQMFLDGDAEALRAYLGGDRQSPAVVGYFERAGVPIALQY
jgi:hypothetical protein